MPANCQLCIHSFEKNTRVATELSYILGYMDVPRLKRHHLVGFVHGGSTFQAPTHYKYNYDLKGTLYMYLEYELGNIYTFTIGILPSWAIRGYQLVRYPCQEDDHHA